MQFKILPIPGDASFRSFYRVRIKKKNKIIVYAKKEKYKNLVAYTAVNNFLRNNKILSPKLFKYNFKKGIIVIEDFGNLSFYNLLSKKKNKIKIYKKLVDLLLSIQKIKVKKKIKTLNKKYHLINQYSNKQLTKESDLFFEWYLPLLFKKKKVFAIKKKTKKILEKIYKKINFPNAYFVHRDYHSQNLISIGKKVGVIDSQDALIGNPAYDLASLIDDVRIKTSKKLKNKIYNYYIKNSFLTNKDDNKNFSEDFNILSVQRSLKIIGIFSRLYKRDKKNKYLKFIPYTWKLLDMRMKSETFVELRKILDGSIAKKKRKQTVF